MKNEVKVLKLITGEEIVTRISDEEDGLLILTSPMVIQQMPDAAGRISVGLVPWSFAGNTDKVTLDYKHVLATLESNPVMEKNYLSSITGISL